MLPIRHIRNGKEEPLELVTMAEGVTRQALFVRAFTEQQPNGQEPPGMSQETRGAIRDLADYLDGQKDSRGIPDQYGIMHPGKWSQQHAAHLMRSASAHIEQDFHMDRMEESTHYPLVRHLLELSMRLTETGATRAGQKMLDRTARGEMG